MPGLDLDAPTTAFLLASAARMSVARSTFYHRATLVAAVSGLHGVQEAAGQGEDGSSDDGSGEGTGRSGGRGGKGKRQLDRRRAYSKNTAARLRRESQQVRAVLSQHGSEAAIVSNLGATSHGLRHRGTAGHRGGRSRGGSTAGGMESDSSSAAEGRHGPRIDELLDSHRIPVTSPRNAAALRHQVLRDGDDDDHLDARNLPEASIQDTAGSASSGLRMHSASVVLSVDPMVVGSDGHRSRGEGGSASTPGSRGQQDEDEDVPWSKSSADSRRAFVRGRSAGGVSSSTGSRGGHSSSSGPGAEVLSAASGPGMRFYVSPRTTDEVERDFSLQEQQL